MSRNPPPLYIFDLDGTLANIEHRRHLVAGEKKYFDEFNLACINDLPIRTTVCVFNSLQHAGCDCWIWTSRDELAERETRDWLNQHGIMLAFYLQEGDVSHKNRLRMRPTGSNLSGPNLKKEWYNELDDFNRNRLLGVFEDRTSVVAMWRSLGVYTFHVDPREA